MLTDVQIKKAKAEDRPYKLRDAGGLFLLVSTKGNRSWRLKYRFGKKEKLLTFGSYPEVSLSRARELREAAKATLREGRDPAVEKKQEAAARTLASSNTFEACARQWYPDRPRRRSDHSHQSAAGGRGRCGRSGGSHGKPRCGGPFVGAQFGDSAPRTRTIDLCAREEALRGENHGETGCGSRGGGARRG